MKKSIVLILAVLLTSTSVFAQGSRAKRSYRSSYGAATASEGFRIGLAKPSMEGQVSASGMGQSFSQTSKIDQSMAFSLGYVNLPIRSIGFTTGLTYIDINGALLRAEGNGAYAFNKSVYAKGGLNLSKLTKSELANVLSPGIGIQAGGGFQINRNFGVEMHYAQMTQKGSVSGIDLEIREAGLEFGISGTF